MSQNPKIEEYDSLYRLLPNRLTVHLIRCARNYPSTQKVTYPYNITHIYFVAEMTTHVGNCSNRPFPVSIMNPDKLTSAESQPSNFCVESAKDWGAEPPAPTYDPHTHCETDPRKIQEQHVASECRRSS